MTIKKCKRCGYKQEIQKEKRKQNKTFRCTECGKVNPLSAILLVAIFSISLMGTAYAETLNLQYDSEFLNYTVTTDNNQTNPDGSIDRFIGIGLGYHYPANVTEFNPEPVKGDPIGKFVELLIGDRANIFSSAIDKIIEDIQETIEEIKEIIAEPEPLTHEEQLLIDNVHKYCDKLNERLTTIGLAFDFEYKSDEYYVTHETQAKKDSEDCRARLHLGNVMLSQMYDALADEAATDAVEFGDTKSTDISQKSNADYSVSGDMWKKRAGESMSYANTTLVKDYGYGQTYDENYQGDPVIGTNDNSPTDRELQIEKLEQKKLADDLAWKAACNTYWKATSYGTTAISSWKLELVDGTCDGRILDYIDENNVVYYLNVSQIAIDKKLAEEEELKELRDGRDTDSEAIKQREKEKAQEEYERLTTIPKTNGTGN